MNSCDGPTKKVDGLVINCYIRRQHSIQLYSCASITACDEHWVVWPLGGISRTHNIMAINITNFHQHQFGRLSSFRVLVGIIAK